MIHTLKLYGDESADQKQERVFAIAGVLGTEAEWGLAMRQWLRRTRGLPFHATECETEYANHPDPQKHRDNLKLYFDLTHVLIDSGLVGFAVALDLVSYREVFPDVIRDDWAYYKCLSDLIGFSARTAKAFNARPEEPDDVRLEFTFDSRLQSNGTAGTLYTMLATHPDWVDSGILDTKIAFDHGDPRLEIGDLLARESMKELDRRVTNSSRAKRGSRRALEECQHDRFRFIERDRDYWLKLRAHVETPESIELQNEYGAWLIRTGKVQNGRIADNMANWIQFNAWLDNRDVIQKKASS